jgi:hypothetical protein
MIQYFTSNCKNDKLNMTFYKTIFVNVINVMLLFSDFLPNKPHNNLISYGKKIISLMPQWIVDWQRKIQTREYNESSFRYKHIDKKNAIKHLVVIK